MKKTITATGTSGEFIGSVLVRRRQVVKAINNAGEKATRTVEVFDVESTVNGHPFGQVVKNIESPEIVKIEVSKHEALLKNHLEKMAARKQGVNLEIDLQKLGFVTDRENKVTTSVNPRKRIANLNDFIKAHTLKVNHKATA